MSNRPYNKTGNYCYQECQKCGSYGLCEHNLSDSSVNYGNVCSGIGGKCNNGSAFACEICNKLKMSNKGDDER